MKSFAIGTLWFSSLVLPIQAADDTVRGVHRELTVTSVNLGAAGNYAILTKAGVSTVPLTSTINGDVGCSPVAYTYLTGFDLITNPANVYRESARVPGYQLTGANNLGDTPKLLTDAVGDMMIAYNDATSRANTNGVNLADGNLGTKTGSSGIIGSSTDPLTPGVYTWGTSVTIGGDITFDGDGVYIFQISGDLLFKAGTIDVTTSSAVDTTKIFWQVTGKVEVEADQDFYGTILAATTVQFKTGATHGGRIYSQTHCALDANTITP
jgi:hypothetical protein